MSSETTTTDPRIPSRDTCVSRYILQHWAEEQPEKTYAVFEDGESWSYARFHERVVRLAAGLAQEGVRQGDHVAVWMFDGKEILLSFFAINYLGAVFVPFNTAYKGGILEHVLDNSDAKLLLAHGQLIDRLSDIETAAIQKIVHVGEALGEVSIPLCDFGTVSTSESALPELTRPIEPWDTQSIIYTSGTTGPSKGVLSSYLHIFSQAGPETWPFVTHDDRFLVNMPLFHVGGMGVVFVMMIRGASIAVMNGFSTERFWPFVRETRTTSMVLLGVMATFLLKQEPAADDLEHDVRVVFMVPLTEACVELKERFGADVYALFNMTEISSPLMSEANPVKRGTCGKARPGVELRLVDNNDCEVATGDTGELIIRTDRPWAMNHGYYKNPEATAQAWRNGWFHTGDCFQMDSDGYYYFVDRMKDAIRRRGENISSFEVETEVVAFPAVREAAAYAVPSELSEDEVMIAIAAVEGVQIHERELIEFLAERMAHFMVPRYVRVLDELPKTPTSKVLKHQLREQAVTADTWDREAHNVRVKPEKLGS